MGNQKLKWTAEEEEALLAGVRKHGPGKWKNILRDADFVESLANRSNIDLKDKWRNLSVAPGIQGSKDKIRTPKIKAAAFQLATVAAAATSTVIPTSSPVAPLPRNGSSDLSIDDSDKVESKNVPRYDGMIFEALSALPDTNGSDVASIYNYIEQQRHETPPNFRRILSSRLRRLATQSKLENVRQSKSGTQNFYKMNGNSFVTKTRTPPPARQKESNVKPRQTSSPGSVFSQARVREDSITAAVKLVEVENKVDIFKASLEEVERMTRLADQAEYILELAREMQEECSRGYIVELK